jgi:hypothetical protein
MTSDTGQVAIGIDVPALTELERLAADARYSDEYLGNLLRSRLNARQRAEMPDWRCGCGPKVTQLECPYHGH